MPRDGSGNYTLPLGNPVVDGTIIDVLWANPTMSDLAVQLNNVVTRDASLGPTVPIRFVDGTAVNPGVTFATQVGTGLYNAAAAAGYAFRGASHWESSATSVTFNVLVYAVKSAVGVNQEVLRLENSGAGASTKARLSFYSNATLYGAIQSGYGASAPEMNFVLPNATAGNFTWVDGAITRMLINSAGNLGVNTNAPISNLDVVGTADGGVQYRTGASTSGVGQIGGLPSIYWGSTTDLIFFSGYERVRIKATGQLRLTPITSDPAGAQAGDMYYNSTTNKHRGYNGSSWNDFY